MAVRSPIMFPRVVASRALPLPGRSIVRSVILPGRGERAVEMWE